MTTRSGFWLPFSVGWLGLIILLVAAWGQWVVRQHRVSAAFQTEFAIANGVKVVAELARRDLLDSLNDPHVVSFCGELIGREGVSGMVAEDGSVFILENLGSIGFPRGSGYQIEWRYWIEDLDLKTIQKPPDSLSFLNELSLRNLLSLKTDRSIVDDELPEWVVKPHPVLIGWRLDAAVYATPLGIETNNCAIRMRFHLDLEVWNPWQESIELSSHAESGRMPVWRWVAEGMPEVNLINHSLGVETGYLSLDAALNESRPQEMLIAAWVEVNKSNSEMEGGSHWILSEPDTRLQPQGLARLLHRSLPIRPADRIELRFRASNEGLTVSLADYNPGVRPQDLDASDVHWRMQGIPLEDFSIYFDRADRQPNPVYRAGSSRDFRRHNSQFRFQLGVSPESIGSWLYAADPRRTHWGWDKTLWAESNWKGSDLFRWEQGPIRGGGVMQEPRFIELTNPFVRARVPPLSYKDWQAYPTDWGGGAGLAQPVQEAAQGILNSSWFGVSESGPKPLWMPLNALGFPVWQALFERLEVEGDVSGKWMDIIEELGNRNRPFATVAELVQSGILAKVDTGIGADDMVLTDKVVWARHGRNFAIVVDIELQDAASGVSIQRKKIHKKLLLLDHDVAVWVQ